MSDISQEKMRECLHLYMSNDRLRKKCVDKDLKCVNMHHSQHRLLMHLSRAKDIQNQKDIAKKFEISQAAIAVALRKLEANGYIKKEVKENDNRFNEIIITDKGNDIIKKSRQAFDEIDRYTFKDFTEEEIDTLTFLLRKMRKNLNEKESEQND